MIGRVGGFRKGRAALALGLLAMVSTAPATRAADALVESLLPSSGGSPASPRLSSDGGPSARGSRYRWIVVLNTARAERDPAGERALEAVAIETLRRLARPGDEAFTLGAGRRITFVSPAVTLGAARPPESLPMPSAATEKETGSGVEERLEAAFRKGPEGGRAVLILLSPAKRGDPRDGDFASTDGFSEPKTPFADLIGRFSARSGERAFVASHAMSLGPGPGERSALFQAFVPSGDSELADAVPAAWSASRPAVPPAGGATAPEGPRPASAMTVSTTPVVVAPPLPTPVVPGRDWLPAGVGALLGLVGIAGGLALARRPAEVASEETIEPTPEQMPEPIPDATMETLRRHERVLDMAAQDLAASGATIAGLAAELKASQETDGRELRERTFRLEKRVEGWEEAAAEMMDAAFRGLSLPGIEPARRETWARAFRTIRGLASRQGLDAIVPEPGDPVVAGLHRIAEGTGETVAATLAPGYRRGDEVLSPAEVRAEVRAE